MTPRPDNQQGAAIVRLRRATVADAAIVHTWRAEPSAARFQPLQIRSIDGLEQIFAQRATILLSPEATGKLQWIVEADGAPVGGMSLNVESREHAIGEIGCLIGTEHRGNGYAAAGLDALKPIAFDPNGLALERLEAVAAVENIASRRSLEKAGFQVEGVLRGYLRIHGRRVDHAIYGFLKTDWEEQRR